MPELTLEKRERLRLHAEQILAIQRYKNRDGNPQWHWTKKQARDYATWMLEVLDALDKAEAHLDRAEAQLKQAIQADDL